MRHLASLALPLVLVASCDILSPKEIDFRQRAIEEVIRRQGLWEVMDLHSYDFDYQRDCAPCSAAALQPVQIHVRNDVITRIVDATGGDVTPQPDIPWPTVDSLYLWTRQLLDDRRFAVEIEFDTVQNFPKHVRGEDPGRSIAEHNASNLVPQSASAPIVAGYLTGTPFSKSNKVTWRSR